jgi:hypothetical protein
LYSMFFYINHRCGREYFKHFSFRSRRHAKTDTSSQVVTRNRATLIQKEDYKIFINIKS